MNAVLSKEKPRLAKAKFKSFKCKRCAERDAAIDLAVNHLQVPIEVGAYGAALRDAVREYDKKISRVIDVLLITKSREGE